jgi:methyltransferase
VFILAVGAERLVELAVARRNAVWSIAHGGKEFGRDHYPAMVSVHIVLVALSTVVRWSCVAVLGKHWNPRLIVIPGAPLVRRGPYRWLHHPNYTAVST